MAIGFHWRPLPLLAAVTIGISSAAIGASRIIPKWWEAGAEETVPAYALYDNEYGKLGVLNEKGGFVASANAFFMPLGPNGRACVTCHQPGNAMSVSVESLRQRWDMQGAKDPVFAAVDGSNCPTLPQDQRSSHSLLLDHGLFRVTRPWPPRDLSDNPIVPEFTIQVVRDPSGCNTDPVYGLKSKTPTISVYRRPRVTANMRFVTAGHVDPAAIIGNKTGLPRARDPETREFIFLPIIADGGQPSIRRQARAAASLHLGVKRLLSEAELAQIEEFLGQIYVAQDLSNEAGLLSGPGNPPALGTAGYKGTEGLVFGMAEDRAVFKSFDMWRSAGGRSPQEEFRASVTRGYDIFFRRPFLIRDVAGFTDIGMGNPYKRTCTICHNGQLSGIDGAPGFMDIGVENMPTADSSPYLPLFKIECRKNAPPHPYLGRTIFTHDPGRALISGKCADVGSINLQQIRGLAARAPYFSSGAAKDLAAVVEYYDKRFELKLNTREKQDLVNFLSVL